MLGQESRYSRSSSWTSPSVSRNDSAASIELSCLSRSSSGLHDSSGGFVSERLCRREEEPGAGEPDQVEARGAEAPLPDRDERAGESFKEIFPLMDCFKDGNESLRRHRAPLMNTSATPVTKKQVVVPAEAKLKKNKQCCKDAPNVSEGEAEEDPALSMRLNKAELLKLQSQIEELKLKVRDKEGVLQTIRKSETRVLEQAEKSELRSRVEELEKELFRRDFLLHSMQHQLAEKHNETGNMRLLIQGLQTEIVRRDHRVSQLEHALDELNLQVVALRYYNRPAEVTPSCCQDEELRVHEDDQGMEDARRRYLAAVSQAKNKPMNEESMALTAELRRRLQNFISLPN